MPQKIKHRNSSSWEEQEEEEKNPIVTVAKFGFMALTE